MSESDGPRAFNEAFLHRMYTKPYPPRPVPAYFKTFADSWLWFLYNYPVTWQQMHEAYPGWWEPETLCTDPGPLDAREP